MTLGLFDIPAWRNAIGEAEVSSDVSADVDYRTRGPKVGEMFPDVRLPDQRGEAIDLHAYRAGRRAVVTFNRSAVW
jgi:hypothetical protein